MLFKEAWLFLRIVTGLLTFGLSVGAILVMIHGNDAVKPTAIYYWVGAVASAFLFVIISYFRSQSPEPIFRNAAEREQFVPHRSQL
jgi:hypothetical protein